jgi:hypothetical protein
MAVKANIPKIMVKSMLLESQKAMIEQIPPQK